MAIQDQSIETRINTMTSTDEKLNEVVKEIDPTQDVAEVMTDTVSNEQTVTEKEPVFIETEEPVQVAGIVPKAVKKMLQKDIEVHNRRITGSHQYDHGFTHRTPHTDHYR